jgi:ribosomal protein L20A (L18A)
MEGQKTFLVKGTFVLGGARNNFSKSITAFTKNAADHKIKSLFGSNYGCRRSMINVESIEEVN